MAEQATADEEDVSREDNLAYFLRVEQMLKEPEFQEDEEQRDLFVGNVLAEVEGSLLRGCCDTVCSRVIERLIQHCSPEHSRNLLRQAIPISKRMLEDRCASHVLQALIVKTAESVGDSDVPEPDTLGEEDSESGQLCTPEESVSTITMIDFIARELQTNLSDYIFSIYSSHVLRTMIATLAGLPLDASMRSKASRSYRQSYNQEHAKAVRASKAPKPVPPSFTWMLKAMSTSILNNNTFDQYIVHATASPVIQTVLDALRHRDVDLCSQYCNKILPSSDTGNSDDTFNSQVEELIGKQIGSHLVEKVLTVSPPEMFYKIYISHFRGKLKDFALHQYSNFVVSKLLESSTSEEQVGMMIDEVVGSCEGILASNHPNVVVKMAEAAARLNVRQTQVLNGIETAFHITTSDHRKDMMKMLCSMAVVEVFAENNAEASKDEEHKDKIVYDQHGARLVQALFRFDSSVVKLLLKSFLDFKTPAVQAMAKSPVGSHVLEAFFKSDVINIKRKQKVLKKLKHCFGQLAVDKFGSHVVDACWACSELTTKEWIAEELQANQEELKASFHGKMIWRNCRLDTFGRNKDEWVTTTDNNIKKRKMFDEFFDESAPLTTTSKKSKHPETKIDLGDDDDNESTTTAKATADGNNDDDSDGDEMDDLFKSSNNKRKSSDKKSKSKPGDDGDATKKKSKKKKSDAKLDSIFAAVEAAKSGDADQKGKKSKKADKKEKKEKKSKKSKKSDKAEKASKKSKVQMAR